LEVVRFRSGDVQEIAYLENGESFSIRKGWSRRFWKQQGGPRPGFNLVKFKKDGLAELRLRQGIQGRLYSAPGSKDIWSFENSEKKNEKPRKGTAHFPLSEDSWAVLRLEPFRYLVRYVPKRPKPPAQPISMRPNKQQFKLLSASMICHLLLIMIIGLVVPDRTLEGYSSQDRFARVDPELLMKLKPPPPKPKAKVKAKKKKLDLTKRKKPIRSVKKRTLPPKTAPKNTASQAATSQPASQKPPDLSQTGLLAALGGGNGGHEQGVGSGQSQILLAAVTNLDAVAVPTGSNTFNLAGIAGKLETSEIQVPTSDVIETIGANELMKASNGSLGALASRGTGTGSVKGIVREPPKTTISIRGGMSREAVLKVVTAHLDEVRDCYERELIHNPGLSGKILLEWLIQPDGTVRYAKIKFNNIGRSTNLHNCIPSQVQTWKFPKPKSNQEVVVTFPFVFESLGF